VKILMEQFDAFVEQFASETPERLIAVSARSYANTIMIMLPNSDLRRQLVNEIYISMFESVNHVQRFNSSINSLVAETLPSYSQPGTDSDETKEGKAERP